MTLLEYYQISVLQKEGKSFRCFPVPYKPDCCGENAGIVKDSKSSHRGQEYLFFQKRIIGVLELQAFLLLVNKTLSVQMREGFPHPVKISRQMKD